MSQHTFNRIILFSLLALLVVNAFHYVMPSTTTFLFWQVPSWIGVLPVALIAFATYMRLTPAPLSIDRAGEN